MTSGTSPGVVRADPAQAALLAALHASCFPPAERWDAAAMQTLLAMPGCYACVAGGARPAGLALARVAADEAELLTIGVLPDSRRRGIGLQLVHDIVIEAGRLGARRLFLEVAVGNGAALALYRGLGGAETGRRRRYYPDGSDALILALPVASVSDA